MIRKRGKNKFQTTFLSLLCGCTVTLWIFVLGKGLEEVSRMNDELRPISLSLNELEQVNMSNINLHWMAPFFSLSGYGTEAISFCLPLSKMMPDRVQIKQYGDGQHPRVSEGWTPEMRTELNHMNHRDYKGPVISVCHSTPSSWAQTAWKPPFCPPTNSIFKIGRTMFETTSVPLGWTQRMNMLDQIWVPSHFQKLVFEKSGVNKEIIVVPEAIDTDFFNPDLYTPMDLPNSADIKYKFLSVFKWEDRKGWRTLIQAFVNEFIYFEGVALYIITHKTEEKVDPNEEVTKFLDNCIARGFPRELIPRIIINSTNVPLREFPRWYKSMDAVVIPSRGEGWGRPHVEAMSMELPLIATYWSGPTEFMTQNNSYPLNISARLVSVNDRDRYLKGHKWADPSVPHLRKLMRHLFENPEEGRKKGKQARKDMVEKYHPDVIADLVYGQLEKNLEDLKKNRRIQEKGDLVENEEN